MEHCPADKCVEREQYWIDRFQSATYGYNLCPKAGSRHGTRHTEETKAKISVAKKGRKLSEETRLKMSLVRTGKKMSEARRAAYKSKHWSKGPNAEIIIAKIRASRIGKAIPENVREKISATKRGIRRKGTQ